MAERPRGYGFSAQVKGKIDAKFDPAMAVEALNWIRRINPETPGPFTSDTVTSALVQEKLKDGVVLCKLMNALSPNSVRKINTSKMAFKQMENIGNFLDACASYGVAKTDLFQTVDLYEGQNIPQVINGLHALGRKAGTKGKPSIGPRESETSKQEFTEQQLRAGDGVIGLQMGSNKGATQAGQNFGKTRAIID